MLSEQEPIKKARGRFKKGQSGNPGGRPKEVAEVRDLSRAHTTEAIERLVQWMRSDNPKASVAACNVILDRAWGKPPQAITGPDGGPLLIQQLLAAVDGRTRGIPTGG